jgi:uncharacterized protein YjbI with pentapeptide repeats
MMDFSSAWRRGLAAIGAVGIAVGLGAVVGAPAATAATCPAVSSTGVVTPAPVPGVDWSGCDLNDANLSAADLSGADLSGAALSGANLTSANLADANLGSARLYYTTMTGANLAGATLASSHLYLVVSGQVTGTPASFPASWSLADGYLIGPYDNLENASLAGADLSSADLENAMITQADLSGTDLANADLTNAELSGSDLSGANLTDANLNTFYVYNLTLTGANLSGTEFTYNSDLSGVVSGDITGTPANLPYYPNGQYVLRGGYLAGPGADLAGADLAGIDFSGASLLAGANLSDANLTGANLTGGALGADISGTELAGANLTDLDSQGDTGTPASLPDNWVYTGGYLLGPTVEAIYANLSGDDLAGLDLAGAQLNYADLASANLSGADLADTYIWYANLTGATVTGANFAGASWLSTTCPDGTNSNIYEDGCFSPLDTTPPVLHLNVKNGQVFAVGSAPQVQCTVTDEYKPITTQPTLTITGHSKHGLGKFTATCSGAIDQAGLQARPVTATYWVAYGFVGMQPGQGAIVPAHPRTLAVSFGLSAADGQFISVASGRHMVRGHDVRVTLRGPGIRPKTAYCHSYSSLSGFACTLHLPHGIKTGRRDHYTLTAYESNGFGFVIAPGEPTAENPVTIRFR